MKQPIEKAWPRIVVTILLLAPAGIAEGILVGDHFGDYYYRLTTKFRGPDMCLEVRVLDILQPHWNNMTELTSCSNMALGQYWRITGPDLDGWFRLSNRSRGTDTCLDVYEEGNLVDQPYMAPCADDDAGQLWMITAEGDYYRLTTKLRGAEMCLDIFNGGQYDNQPHLVGCAAYSGQFWKLTATDVLLSD